MRIKYSLLNLLSYKCEWYLVGLPFPMKKCFIKNVPTPARAGYTVWPMTQDLQENPLVHRGAARASSPRGPTPDVLTRCPQSAMGGCPAQLIPQWFCVQHKNSMRVYLLIPLPNTSAASLNRNPGRPGWRPQMAAQSAEVLTIPVRFECLISTSRFFQKTKR